MPTYLEPTGVPQWGEEEKPRREQFNKAFSSLNDAYAGINTDALIRAETAANSAAQDAKKSAAYVQEAQKIAAATELQYRVDGDRFGLKRPVDQEFAWTDHLTGPEGPTGKPLHIAGRFSTQEELAAAYPEGNGDNSYLVDRRIYVYADGAWRETEVGGTAGTVNGQPPDAKGDIKLTAEHVPIEVPKIDAGNVQEAIHILKKDGDKVREYFTPEGAAKNAAALNNIPGKNYLPEKITGLAGAKSYEYAAPMACVARPSFAGRTVQAGTPGVDNPAAVKGVLNPWTAAYTGPKVDIDTRVQAEAAVSDLHRLPNDPGDQVHCKNGQWGIERNIFEVILDGTGRDAVYYMHGNWDRGNCVGFWIATGKNINKTFCLQAGGILCSHLEAKDGSEWDADSQGICGSGSELDAFNMIIPKTYLSGWTGNWTVEQTKAAVLAYFAGQYAKGIPVRIWAVRNEPVFEPVPAWSGFGKIEPIAGTTTITKPNPDAPISPDNVATITGTPVVTTGYRGQVRQITGELFEGDSFDGVNLTANGTVSRRDMDLQLSPGGWTIEAGDENGLLESVSMEMLPDSAVYGRKVYPYQHIKEGTVHKLTGTPGAAQIILNATDVYQDGDTWTLNGAAVSVTYADGQALLPTAVIAGDVVQAAVEGGAVRLMLQKPTPQPSIIVNGLFDAEHLVNQRGKKEYTTSGYNVDMWFITLDYATPFSVKLENKGLTISTSGPGVYFRTILPSIVLFQGKQITISLGDFEGHTYCITGNIPDSAPENTTLVRYETPLGAVIFQYWGGVVMLYLIMYDSAVSHISSIKLELGPRFTGWYEPKPGETLAECQRYFEPLAWHSGLCVADSAETIVFGPVYYFKTVKRAFPTIQIFDSARVEVIEADTMAVVPNCTIVPPVAYNPYMVCLSINGNFVRGRVYRVMVNDGAAAANAEI